MLEVGWWEVIKGSFQKHLKTGDGYRQKLFVGGRGFEGVTTPVMHGCKALGFMLNS